MKMLSLKKTQDLKKKKVRLYSRATVLSYKRSRKNQDESKSLLNIEGVQSSDNAKFYLGKRVAYITYNNNSKSKHDRKINWGKVIKIHGNNGIVIAKFKKNLPPQSFGKVARVFLYPSNI